MAFTSEDLFTAIQTIVDKAIKKVKYDKTIICTIEDNSKASEGEYTVSDGSISFTAYSETTRYTKNAKVYVIIPEGDYENKKLILGKYIGDSNTPYTYKAPTENYVEMTGDLVNSKTTWSILANNPNKITTKKENYLNINTPLVGYNRLGISANFQTLFSAYNIISGHYGLALEITGIRNDKVNKENAETSTETVFLDTDDMFGNPYGFLGAVTQEKVFDISGYSEISNIKVYLYQSNDFIDNTNTRIPYQTTKTIFNEKRNLPDNIFVSNISITAGYDNSSFDKDTILLYTLDSKVFSSDNFERNLQIRYIKQNEDGSFSQVKNLISYWKENEEIPSGAKPGEYFIHWYQWDLTSDTFDDIAGAFWKEIRPDTWDSYKAELRGATKVHEHFKVIIEQNIIDTIDETSTNTEEFQKRYYESEVLEFTNENGSVETNLAVDLVSGLSLSTNDGYNGVYAIYTPDGKLMNQAEAYKERYITVSYQSLVTGLTEFDGAENITWQIPKNNTMIIVPDNQDGLILNEEKSDDKIKVLEGKINPDIDDSSIIGENNIRGAKLKFKIKQVYSQNDTNNTIKCLIIRQGFQYATQMTLRFAPSGTNGTDYTLVLEIDSNQEYTAIPLDQDSHFSGLNIAVQLQNYENKPIEGKVSLRIENDDSLQLSQSEGINSGEIVKITKKTENNIPAVSGYGKIVATTYVWVKKNQGEDKLNNISADDHSIQLTAYLPLSYAAHNYCKNIIEGPLRVIYDAGGSNPTYTKLPYNLYDSNGKVGGITWSLNCENKNPNGRDDRNQIGKIEDGLYIPPAMLINGLGPVWVEGKIDGSVIWKQRLLLEVNRFGLSMLNRWDGSLQIDNENNQILSSIITAGSKNNENQFTGIVMGDIGKDIGTAKTGLYGYNKGIQAFSFLTDGTATIGQAGKGALIFNGNTGTINSENYLNGESGMLLDFDDAQLLTKLVKIRGQAKENSNILEIDGFNINDENQEVGTSQSLMRVGKKNYFLQSANFDDTAYTGFKLDLGKNKITGFNTDLSFYNTTSTTYLKSGNIGSATKIINNKTYYITEDYVDGDSPKEENEGLTWDLAENTITVEDKQGLLTLHSSDKKYPLTITDPDNGNNKVFKLGWDGSMQATSGMIGNWVIGSNSLTTNGGKIGMAGWTNQNGPIFWSGGKALEYPGTTWHSEVGFGVSAKGELFANDGQIGGWSLSSNGFSVSIGDYDIIEGTGSNKKYYKFIRSKEAGTWKFDEESQSWQGPLAEGKGTHIRREVAPTQTYETSISSDGTARFKNIYLSDNKLYLGYVPDTTYTITPVSSSGYVAEYSSPGSSTVSSYGHYIKSISVTSTTNWYSVIRG